MKNPRASFGSSGRVYVWTAFGIAAMAFAGFARTFYLRNLFDVPRLSNALQVHGVLMSVWVGLFITQTWLIAAHRITWHRRVGIIATLVAILVIVSGVSLTIAGVENEIGSQTVGRFHYLLGLNLVNLALFGVFLLLGVLNRRRSELHKRFMLLAALMLLAPAVARLVLLLTHGVFWQFSAFYLCLVAGVAMDVAHHKRIHPVLGGGVLLIIVAFQGVYAIERSDAWLPFVHRMFA